MSTTVYHPGGFMPAAPAQNRSEQWDDTTQTYTSWDINGQVITSRSYSAAEAQSAAAAAAVVTADTNRSSLQQRAQAALAVNAAYLALASPTAAQTTAATKSALRQLNALIRLNLGQFDDTSGT